MSARLHAGTHWSAWQSRDVQSRLIGAASVSLIGDGWKVPHLITNFPFRLRFPCRFKALTYCDISAELIVFVGDFKFRSGFGSWFLCSLVLWPWFLRIACHCHGVAVRVWILCNSPECFITPIGPPLCVESEADRRVHADSCRLPHRVHAAAYGVLHFWPLSVLNSRRELHEDFRRLQHGVHTAASNALSICLIGPDWTIFSALCFWSTGGMASS